MVADYDAKPEVPTIPKVVDSDLTTSTDDLKEKIVKHFYISPIAQSPDHFADELKRDLWTGFFPSTTWSIGYVSWHHGGNVANYLSGGIVPKGKTESFSGFRCTLSRGDECWIGLGPCKNKECPVLAENRAFLAAVCQMIDSDE